MEKNELRKIYLKKIKDYDDKKKASEMIVLSLLETKEYRDAETILAFYPLPSEPDITPLLSDRRILLPFFDGDDMKFGRGELEKSEKKVMTVKNRVEVEYEKAVILVPLLAYDTDNYRLGRGGGYYDRYIRKNRARLFSIGIGYSVSRTDALPHDSWDERLCAIIAQ